MDAGGELLTCPQTGLPPSHFAFLVRQLRHADLTGPSLSLWLWDFSTHLPVLHDTGCCIVPRQGRHQARVVGGLEARGSECGCSGGCGVVERDGWGAGELVEWRKAIECLRSEGRRKVEKWRFEFGAADDCRGGQIISLTKRSTGRRTGELVCIRTGLLATVETMGGLVEYAVGKTCVVAWSGWSEEQERRWSDGCMLALSSMAGSGRPPAANNSGDAGGLVPGGLGLRTWPGAVVGMERTRAPEHQSVVAGLAGLVTVVLGGQPFAAFLRPGPCSPARSPPARLPLP